MLLKLFSGFIRLWAWLRGKSLLYLITQVNELPDTIKPQTVYVVGENNHTWFAAMLCPCGCQETIQLSLLTTGRPRWTWQKHWNRTVTLHPSVWRQKGCRSHFFIRKGQVTWCK